MKTIKTAVAALLIAGGTIAAFAFTKADPTSEPSKQATLHWYQPTGSNPSFIRSNTISNEESASGCERDNNGCERGYSSSQLNNPTNPSLGVKPSEVGSPMETLGAP